MKRLALVALLVAIPAVVLGSTQHYIVTTSRPFEEAVQRLPREDFGPAPRAPMHVRPFHYVFNGFDADLTDEQVQRLIASGEVEDIGPGVERHVMDDAIVPGQQITTWGVKAVKAQDVWPVTKGLTLNGTGPIHVAVIDTGIDYNNPELRQVYKGGKNEITGTNDPLDDFGHGTHVSGIIAAADDGEGVVGVAPGVDIYAFKVLDQCGSGSSISVEHAIDDIIALKNQIGGNWVVNLSLGSDSPDPTGKEQQAFAAGQSNGIIFVAAAGNSYDDSTSSFFQTDGLAYPAAYPGVLSVGAVDSTLTIAAYSQHGSTLSVVAPGGIEPDLTHDGEVLSTTIDGQVILPDGTKSVARWSDAFSSQNKPLCVDHTGVTAPYVYCGTGRPDEIPQSVVGKIALVERGGTDPADPTGFFFVSKMKYAKAAGAIGVAVYNIPGRPMINPALTGVTANIVIPFALISEQDGAALKGTSGTITLDYSHDHYSEIYLAESGTSMATPHTTGVVALAWAVAPNATANDVQNAVINTATDLGAPGFDTTYGNGLVNAGNAAKQLNPAAFGVPVTPPPKTGRVPGRRGH